MSNKTYYKIIVRTSKEVLTSSNQANPIAITYTPGEWTTAPGDSYLFVFSTYSKALFYIQNGVSPFQSFEIWSCSCQQKAAYTPVSILSTCLATTEEFLEFWEKPRSRGKRQYTHIPIPSGTKLFKQVRLEQLIEKVPALISHYTRSSPSPSE